MEKDNKGVLLDAYAIAKEKHLELMSKGVNDSFWFMLSHTLYIAIQRFENNY